MLFFMMGAERASRLNAPIENHPLNLGIEDLNAQLETTPAGLTAEEAERRIEKYGPNELARKARRSVVVTYLLHFTEPLALVLMAAGIISAFFGESRGAIMIGVMILLSVTLDFVQEYRSEKTAERLAEQVAVTATVLRDGSVVEIPIREIVPGDIIQLGVGDVVPADARVLSAKDFFLHQASLTGESFPVEKVPNDHPAGRLALADMNHAVFFGTNVVSGTATAMAVETGSRTEFGRLAKSLTADRPETEFQRGVRGFTSLLMKVIAILVAGIFILNVIKSPNHILDAFLFAVAVSVGITPELLPMIMTINMSVGAAAMAKHKVVVKRLQSIQNLGSMDILCTDKTGTLTEGRLDIQGFVDAAGQESPRTIALAKLNSGFQASLRNPMDAAIAGYQTSHAETGYIKVDEIPFDFTRRRMTVIVERQGERLLITKGAPESVMDICTSIEVDGEVRGLTPEFSEQARNKFLKLSADGYRAVAVAYRPVNDNRTVYSLSDEAGLTFVGFVSFIDPPKESAADSLADLNRLGVAVKILTGDNELVTRRICERVGLAVASVLTGQEIEGMDDKALAKKAEQATICARLSPEQKNRVITVLKKAGHVVGYMGDGINDTPSLRTADVGISVNNAVDVAKEAADIVLLEEGLHILEYGIVEGRRTFANTIKYIMMGTSSNFGNMFSVPVASMLVPFLPMLPMQILLNNLLYDFSQVSIPTDKVDEDYISRPRRWDINFIRRFMLWFGPISSLYDVLTYMVMLYVFHAGPALFQTGWFVESLATQTLVIHVIRSRHSIFKSRASIALWATTLAAVAAGIVIPYTSIGAFFGFTPLPLDFFAVLAVMVGAYLLMVEGMKRWFYKRFGW